jgi:Domain of unknown function (DUF1789).
MFHINAKPTFDADLVFTGQGREQTLHVTFKHKTRTEYLAMLEKIRDDKLSVADALLSIVEKWDADEKLSAASIAKLQDQQPGIDFAIITGYGDALAVARKGN